MSQLMVSISGIRGVYGEGLTDAVAERFAYAYATIYKGTIVVGRDSRISGKAVAAAVMRGIAKAGGDVIDIGLASTPTTEMAVMTRKASGGIIITASHNPTPWNGLKMLSAEGIFLNADQAREVIDTYDSLGDIEGIPEVGTVEIWDGANAHHIDAVLDLDVIDGDLIAGKKFTVALDTVNGAGSPILADLLDRLGCTVTFLNPEPTGDFAHNPEPVPGHLGDLCTCVKDVGADVGFAVDPDVDRLSIVDNRGVAIGEEYTLAMIVDFLLGRVDGDTVVNLSTSRMIDDAASKYGRTAHRSAIGEINVVGLMKETGVRIGGEGNGGVIYPALHYGRDAVLGVAMMLQVLAESDASVAELAARFPVYVFLKEKADLQEDGEWREAVKSAFETGEVNEVDGVKVSFDDSWVHVRASNTEPIVRIYAEAPSEEKARSLVERIREVL